MSYLPTKFGKNLIKNQKHKSPCGANACSNLQPRIQETDALDHSAILSYIDGGKLKLFKFFVFMYFVSLLKFPDFCRFSKGAPSFYKILKTYMILLFLIIILIGLNILKLVWSKNNASMNFRGGKMLEVNNVIGREGFCT